VAQDPSERPAQPPAAASRKEQSASEKVSTKPAGAVAATKKKADESRPAAAGRQVKKSSAADTRRRLNERDDEVRVRTKAEMEKAKSQFLSAPGGSPADRYGPDGAIDWTEIPAWRQTSFFGVRARGQFFIYVVDCSESMIDDDRMPRATIELRRSVFGLQEPQRFEVIFYNHMAIPMPGGPIPRSADHQNKEQLRSFLRLIEPDGGTDPRPAMRQALSLRPDAIFLLSDGAFPDGTVDAVTRMNKNDVPIHCIDLTAGLAGDHLRRIAAANNGHYAARMGDLQGRP